MCIRAFIYLFTYLFIYLFIYQKVQELGGRTTKTVRTFEIKDYQGNLDNDQRRVIIMWGNHISRYKIYMGDSENHPKYIVIEAKRN